MSVRVLLVLVLLCAAPAVATVRPLAASPDGTTAVDHTGPMARAIPTMRPVPAVRDVSPEPTHYPPLQTMRATIRVEGDLSPKALERVRGIEGVAHATRVHVARVAVGAGPNSASLVVGSVDPAEYRPLSPQVTADAVDVWRRLDEGAIAVTHEHAQRLHLDVGGVVRLGGAHGPEVRVGAAASNGVPPLADALVGRATGAQLGIDRVPPTILVATADAAVPSEVAVRLSEQVAGEVTVIPDPRAPHPVAPTPPAGSTVWDVLAMCESSGDWQANTGNGFYGGLQFLPESWWLVGGEGLPHEASREEQIHRAERLLARQGWKAWPVCSIRVGLREDPGNVG